MTRAAVGHRVVLATVLAAAVAACGGPTQSAGPSPTDRAGSLATPASSPATAELFDCTISSPSRFQDDPTPVVIHIEGLTEAVCRSRIQGEKAADPFYHTHPETLLDQPPSSQPRCSEIVDGHRETVWGTGMATIYCRTIIFMAVGSFPPEFR